MSRRPEKDVAALWRRSLQVEAERNASGHSFLQAVISTAHHQPDFGLVISVTNLPDWCFTPQWLDGGEDSLLTPTGAHTWNLLLTLAHELAGFACAPGDLAAVVLHPKAIDTARARLKALVSGEKKEAA